MKTCNRCLENKDDDDFPSRKYDSGKVVLGPYCRECKREYDREYWAANAKYRKSNMAHAKERVLRNTEYVRNVLRASGGCIDCGESRPIVLEFDHLGDKEHNISDLSRASYSIAKIQKEIDKCEIVCANCHRIRTAKRGGWFYGE